MTDPQTLERGRERFARKARGESYRLLQEADRDFPLDAEELERLAIAAYLVGRDDDCEAFSARAHRGIVDSCPGLYLMGLLFLYSLSSSLLEVSHGMPEHIVDHIVAMPAERA